MDAERSELISLISVGLVARDGCHPDWAVEQANRKLEQHDRRQLLPPKSPCRTCGSSLTPDPESVREMDH